MSDIRTLPDVGGNPHERLIGLAAGLAAGAANKLARTRILKYEHCRGTVAPTGASRTRLMSGQGRHSLAPDLLTGWVLKSKPFFLSDPHDGFGGALFIYPTLGHAELVDGVFARETLAVFPADDVLPPARLTDVYHELLGILAP